MYGLPKIHKRNTPLRPIISSIGTFNYNLAKFLADIILPLTVNKFTLENSIQFTNEIRSLNFNGTVIMASFDVESLFTNVPLDETTNIILDNIDNERIKQYGLDKNILEKMLNIATKDSVFTFDNKLYSQIDGVAMGSPLSCCYANTFLCFWETIWLNNCPKEFKPLFYRRYVDDTFLIFKDPQHIQKFLDYLNAQHINMKFTCEIETNCKIPFLDTLVTRTNNNFSTSVYRKSTYTGLGLNFLSFSPLIYKLNSIKTLLNRAYNICSSYVTFDQEVQYLQNYFFNNSYPTNAFYNIVRSFFNKKYAPQTPIITVPKDIRYIKLPYLGNLTFDLRNNLDRILKDAYPQVMFKFIFTNNFTIGSYLRKRDSLPEGLSSCVVYEFSCPDCNARYVGSCSRWLQHRIAEHMGRSVRTGMPLTKPSHSAIRDHSHQQDHIFTNQDFKVLTKVTNKLDLLITESIYIKIMKPELNGNILPIQLFIN